MAEIALAVVPIFFGALKGFSKIRETAHMLRHYPKEITDLRNKVEVQFKCFESEIHHLIIDALGDRAQDVIGNENHEFWRNGKLGRELELYLGGLYQRYAEAMERINEELEEIATRLSVFATPNCKSSKLKETKDSFRLAFKKEQYRDSIRQIKEWIALLKTLRKLARKMPLRKKADIVIQKDLDLECLLNQTREKPKHARTATSIQGEDHLDDALRQYTLIRRVSSRLQSVVRENWSCSYSFHSHVSRLFFEPDWEQKRVIWMLETTGHQGHAVFSNRCLFWVEDPREPLTPESVITSFSNSDREVVVPSHKRPRTSIDESPTTIGNPYFERRQSADCLTLCERLEGCATSSCAESVISQVDKLTTQERLRFKGKDLSKWDGYTASPATELFGQPVDAVSNRERVRLALALLKATLINYSTPAWPKGSMFDAIDILKRPDAPVTLPDALETLNFRVQVGNSGDNDMDMEDGCVASEEELWETYGIQNQVLYRLGVALLSIGLWTKVDWREFGPVRRKARALDSLGGTYRKAVERLIWANFNVPAATNLDSEDLRKEIIQNVIYPLERKANRR